MYKKIYYLAIFLLLGTALMTTCKLDNDTESPSNSTTSPNGPVIPAPDTPIVTASNNMLTVSWNAVEGAEKYEVYLSTEQQPPASPLKIVTGTITVLKALINKTTYYVWIKALTGSGSSNFSPSGRGIPWSSNEPPATPGTPVVIPGVNQLTVNWEECGGADSYELYINTIPTPPYAPEITTDKTSAVINNLENNIIYYIWVRSANKAGRSDYSSVEAGKPREPTIAPISPDTPLLTAGSRQLTVSWQAVEFASAYEVWLGTTDNSAQAVKQGGDITGGITETVITGLINETTYYVWIKAKNFIGTSGFSPSASEKPSVFDALPLIPAAPAVTVGNRELIVNWPSAEGALSYEVWKSTADWAATAQKHGEDIFSTSITLTGLTNNTTYYIWVKAKNIIGTSELSPRASGTPSAFAAAPIAPQTAPIVIDGTGQLSVSWSAVEGASAYEVWMGTDTNPTLATKRGSDVTTPNTYITSLTNGTTYYIWIKAKNSIGTSGFSPMATGMPSSFTVPPQTPLAVPSVSLGNGQITVTWLATEGAMSYEIWINTVNNSSSATKNGGDINAALSATIENLTNGLTYYVWIKAKNDIGTSGFSPVASGKPIANATAPNLIASNGQLSVTWAAITGADQYEVFCGTGINPPQSATQTTNASTTSATISGLTNGTTYTVWIRGKNSTGTGVMSNTSAQPIGNMGTVTVTAGGSGELVLNWSAVAGADQYDVYHNTANSIPASPSQTVSTTTATISSLTNGTTYYAWVKPKNANGTGNANTVVSGKPLGTPRTPTVSPAYKGLLVTWTAVAGADEYEVYYGITTPTTLATTTTGTTATISGLTNGTTYYVHLRAKNAIGSSEYGPSVSAVPNVSPGLYRNTEKIGTQNLTDSLIFISSNAVSGDEYYIVLGANESISPKTLSYSDKTVGITLLGYGGEKIITLNTSGSMFTVNSGVTLTLDKDITLVGMNTNTSFLVHVLKANLIMNDGAKISDNKNTKGGGGIYVQMGTFTMNGGKISGNTSSSDGGGVYVANSTFTMNGGEITSNSGGGVRMDGGTFTMSGGEISGNTTSSYGGGVYMIGGTFTKSGGIITGYASDNVDGNVVKNSSGIVQSNKGHAVYVTSAKRRETTAGAGVNMDSSVSGTAGGWEN